MSESLDSASSSKKEEPNRMVVYLRFPFARNGFQDPPQVRR